MTQLLQTLFHMSLTAAFVAVVVFLLRLALKGRVARQMVCLLWLLVFARLLIPVTLQSPVSLVPDMELNDPSPVVSEAPETVPTLPVNTSPVATVPPNVSAPAVTFPVQNPVVTIPPNVSAPYPVASAPITEQPPAVETPPVTEPSTPFPWATVLTVVWAAGVAAMLVYGVGSYLSIRRKLRFAIRTKEGWWEDPHLRSPFILGLFRPKIYLPCHMTPYARRFILCHEQAHIRRGDHIVKPLCWLALAIHWFNPLAWVAFLLLSRDIEVACDEKVLRELGSEVKADYSATLLALATNGRFPAPTPLAFGEGDAKTRIKGVLNFKKPALWVTIAAVVIAVVAAVCLLTDPMDKFNPDDYTTYDYYPGLYFEEVTDERTGETTAKAYKLVDNKPALVAGWMDYPADNLATLIQPDGEEKVLFAPLWEVTAQYEQYLVDYMMEQDEGWAEYYLTKVNRISPYEPTEYPVLSTVHGEAALTREGNMLLYWNKRVQILPLQPSITDASSYEVQYHTADIDGFDGLTILWKEGRKVYAFDPSSTLLFKGDALITYIWDGETWTAHDSLDTIAYGNKPVSFDADKQLITVTYDPNAHTNGNPNIAHIDPGMIQRPFPIPEELGRVESISISGQAQIARREDGDYDLIYAVFAMPEGGTSDADQVHVLDLTAIMKWNSLTEEFEITFTGAEKPGKIVIGEGSQTYPILILPEGSELLADINIASLHLLEDGTVLLRYGDEIVELKDFGYNAMRPDCEMWATDIDGDGVKQLHIIHQFGSGTGVSIDRLTTVTPTEQGLEVSYHDWSEQELDFETSHSFVYYPKDNSIALVYKGEQLWLRLPDSYADLDWDAFGSQTIVATVVHYSLNPNGTINLAFTPALSDGSPMVHYLPMTANYTLEYKGGVLRQVGGCELKADEEGMLVQPFAVTMLEAAIHNGVCQQFELTLDGKTVTFEGAHVTDRDILTYYIDLTGDGVADPLILLTPSANSYGYYLAQEVYLFDGVTLKKYPNTDGMLRAYSSHPYTFTSDEDNFYITADGLDVTLPKADILSYWANYPALSDVNFFDRVHIGSTRAKQSISVKDGMICVTNLCMVGRSGQYYGQLETYMVLSMDYGYPVPVPVRTAYIFPDGTRVEQSAVLTTLASLPEEEVYLYTDGKGSFWLDAYGHYGPVPDWVSDLLKSPVSDIRKGTATNLSGPEFEFISVFVRNTSFDVFWNEEQNAWVDFPYVTTLSSLPRDMVTPETLPTNPEWYYKVAESQSFALYARNWGEEIMLTYGNFFWNFDHCAHTPHMNLPVMEELDDETVAVISEVNTGTGVGVDELVVYDATLPVATDYLYDWRDLAADFNRNNTLTYDKETNSLTLEWNGKTYSSGKLAYDLSMAYELEDGFTGALIATGDLVRYTSNGDGTFTIRIDTAIGRGNKGGFNNEGEEWFWRAADQANHYYPMSTGITGLDLVWTVRFTGNGFEVVEPLAIADPTRDAALQSFTAFLNNGLNAVNAHSGEEFSFSQISQQITTDESLRFIPSHYALVDLDGDGREEMILDLLSEHVFYGHLILRYQEGVVYGFTFATREFNDVRVDGTFLVSSGANDYGICRIAFHKVAYAGDQFAYSETLANGEILYVVNHQRCSQAEFDAAFEAWQATPSVRWVALSADAPNSLTEGASLVISLPEAGLYIYTPGPTAEDAMEHLVIYEGRSHRFDRFGDGISDLRLTDLDGDGVPEIAITGWFGMGGTFGHVLTVLKRDGQQWRDYRLSTVHEGDLPAKLRSSSARITGASGDAVSMELAGLTHQLTVGSMLVEQSGTFRLSDSGCPYSILWFDRQPYLRLQGKLYKTGTGLPSGYCNTGYELLVRLDFKADGAFDLVPMSLSTLCASLSSSPAELREGEFAQYGECDLLLLDLLPESGTCLYRDGDGQLWLRDGGDFALLNAELYNPSNATFSLVRSRNGEVTLHVIDGLTGTETDAVFALTEVYSEADRTSSTVWLPRVSMMPRF